MADLSENEADEIEVGSDEIEAIADAVSEDAPSIGFDPDDPFGVGFSLGKLKISKKDLAKMTKVAMVAGPVIAVAFPAAAPAVIAGVALLKAAQAKDAKALAKMAAIQGAAASGNEDAISAAHVLEVAQTLDRHAAAKKLASEAAAGSPDAQKQIAMLRQVAPSNPQAAQALSAVSAVQKGSTWPAYFEARFRVRP